MSFVCIIPVTLSADMGPKDRLTVYVQNPPSQLYYLDLLTQTSIAFNNFTDEERAALNANMINALYYYQDYGWIPALTEGTGAPLFGKLTGDLENNQMVHTFSYVGVPQTYRIIIATESGQVVVSDVYTRKAQQSSITIDYLTGRVVVPSVTTTYILQFITTCVPTLVLEMLILFLFGFSVKRNFLSIFIVNVATQVLLTVTMGATLIKSGTWAAYMVQFPVELIIIIVEMILYSWLLKDRSLRRRMIYTVTANLVSWLLGFLIIPYQYRMILDNLI